jgi:exonuclease SbcC
LKGKEAELVEATLEYQKYEDLMQTIRDLTNQFNILSVELQGKMSSLEKARQESIHAEKAFRIVESNRENHEQYLQSQQDLNVANAEKEEYDKVLAEIQRITHEIELQNSAIDGLREKVEESKQAEKDLVELNKSKEEYAALQAEIAKLNSLIRYQAQLEDDLRIAENNKGVLENSLIRIRNDAELVAGLTSEIDELEKDIEVFSAELNTLEVMGVSEKTKIELLEQRKSLLEESESTCPVCDGELTDAHRKELLTEIQNDIIELKRGNDQTREWWKNKHNELETAKRNLSTLRNKSKDLALSANLLENHEERYAELNTRIDNFKSQLDECSQQLATLPAKLSRMEELEELNQKRIIAQNIASGLSTREGVLSHGLKNIEDYQVELIPWEEKAENFIGLEEWLQKVNHSLEICTPAHNLYITNINQANTRDTIRENINELEQEIKRLEKEISRHEHLLELNSNDYDESSHQSAESKKGDLTAQIAVCRNTLELYKKMLKEAEIKLTEMNHQMADLMELETKNSHLDDIGEALKFIRKTIRDAGPEVTKMIVASVSINADILFSEIMQDPTAHLQWTEDYDIIISNGDQVRHFNQLSGGEQMSAALSVRLALLKEISNIDIAFFDEPTVNLDTQRRESLAEQILGVQGFSQLFVISHDDTFETGTDHVVRVHKENGVSMIL